MLKIFLLTSTVFCLSIFASTWTQTTESDFSLGEFNSAEVSGTRADAKVQLAAASSTEFGSKLIVEGPSNLALTTSTMQYSVRFTATTSISVSAIHVCVSKAGTMPDYRLEIVANAAGDLPTGTSLTSVTISNADVAAAGWKTKALASAVNLVSGNVYHLKVSHVSGTINGGNNMTINGTTPLMNISYTNTTSSSITNTANTDNYLTQMQSLTGGASWTDRAAQPMFIIEGVDPDDPTKAILLGSSYSTFNNLQQIYSNRYFGERISNSAITIKEISFRVKANIMSPTPDDHLYVTLLNVTDGVDVETVKLVDKSNITTVFTWYTASFSSPHTLDASKVYRLYLKSPNSTNVRYYLPCRVEGFATAYTKADKVSFGSDDFIYTENTGSSWVENVNRYDILFSTKDSTYSVTGDFSSSVFDAGSTALFNTISFLPGSQAAGTTLKIQAASSNSESGPWTYHGPDATTATYYTVSAGEALNAEHSAKRYFRYKAFLDSSSALVTPYLESVSVSYSLRQMPGTDLQTVCYPSPFSPSKGILTCIYILSKDSNVTVKIYSITGSLVKTMSFASGTEGGKGISGGYNNKVEWDGKNGDGMTVGNGVYIMRFTAEPADGSGSLIETKKIMVAK